MGPTAKQWCVGEPQKEKAKRAEERRRRKGSQDNDRNKRGNNFDAEKIKMMAVKQKGKKRRYPPRGKRCSRGCHTAKRLDDVDSDSDRQKKNSNRRGGTIAIFSL